MSQGALRPQIAVNRGDHAVSLNRSSHRSYRSWSIEDDLLEDRSRRHYLPNSEHANIHGVSRPELSCLPKHVRPQRLDIADSM